MSDESVADQTDPRDDAGESRRSIKSSSEHLSRDSSRPALPVSFSNTLAVLFVIFLPLFGIVLFFWTALVILLGKVEVNGTMVTYADSPGKFIAVLVAATGAGFGCLLIAWLGYRRFTICWFWVRFPPPPLAFGQ